MEQLAKMIDDETNRYDSFAIETQPKGKIMKSIYFVSLAFVIILNSVYGQEGQVESNHSKNLELPRIQVYPIQDTESGRQYELLIKLPASYHDSTKHSYPVIYYTDAMWHVEMVSGITDFMLENAILVGISWQKDLDEQLEKMGEHVSRYRDYSVSPSNDLEKQAKYQFGQAQKHLEFIRRDVLTNVERNFRTEPNNRTYFGYSLGGLFGAYVLMKEPDAFKNYIIGSPSLWRDVPFLSALNMDNQLNANVFITHGSAEDKLENQVQAFVANLSARDDESLSLTYEIIEGTHQTASPLTLLRGVRWLHSMIDKKLKSSQYTIAYSSKESGNGELYLTDNEGESKIQITNFPENDGYVEWSPDGKRLVSYAYHDDRKTWSIHVMNADGSDRRRLTHAKNKWDSSPRWSPDGEKIVFSRGYADADGNWQEEIWITNADGSQQRQIQPLSGGGPCFTPDGKIVFHSKTNTSEICIANADGSDFQKLTNNAAEDWHPEVSPDGRSIAFISNRDGNQEIYVMNVDGTNQRRLTFSEADDWYPSWSPDGLQLLFSTEGEEYPSIYRINVDGSSLEKIIENGSNPSWLKFNRNSPPDNL